MPFYGRLVLLNKSPHEEIIKSAYSADNNQRCCQRNFHTEQADHFSIALGDCNRQKGECA